MHLTKLFLLSSLLINGLQAKTLEHEFYFSNNVITENTENIKNNTVLENKLIYKPELNKSLLASFNLINNSDDKILTHIHKRIHIGKTYLLNFKFIGNKIEKFSLHTVKNDNLKLKNKNNFYFKLLSFQSYQILNYNKKLSTIDKTIFLKNQNKLSLSFK